MRKSCLLKAQTAWLTGILLLMSVRLFSQNYYEDTYIELKDSLYYPQIDNHLNLGEYDSLVGLSSKAFEYYYALGQTDRANYLFNVCVYYPLGGYLGDTLMQLIDRHIAFLRKHTDTINVHYATLLHIKSFGCKYVGNYDEAIPYMETALAIYRQVNTPLLHISSGYYNLAGLRFYQGRMMESYQLYKNALIGFNTVNPNETKHFTWIKYHDAGSTYLGLALAMKETQQIELAAAFDKKAYHILRNYYPDSDVTVIAMINLASDELKLGNNDQAIEYATMAEDWITDHEAYDRFHDVYYSIHAVRGDAHKNLGDFEVAMRDFRVLEAHVLQQYPNDSLQLSEVNGLIAANFSAQHLVDSALVYYQKALSYNPGSFSIHSSLAQTYARAGMPQEAILTSGVNLKQLLNGNSKPAPSAVPAANDVSDDFRGYQTASALAHDYLSLYQQSGDVSHLTHSLRFASLSDTLMGRYRDATLIGGNDRQLAKDYHQLAETGIQAGFMAYQQQKDSSRLEDLWRFFIQSTAYKLSAEVNQMKSPSELSTRQTELLRNIRQLENQLQVLQNKPDSMLESQVFDQLIANRMEAFELSYSLQNTHQKTQFNHLFSRITLTEIQQQLSEKEGLATYFMGKDRLFCFLIKKNDELVTTIAVDDAFKTQLTAYHKGLKTGSPDFVHSASALYQRLIGPLEKKMIGLGKLVVIPDGELSRIPFEALTSPEDQEFLIQKIAISYNYSAFLWLKSSLSVPPYNTLSFAGFAPVFSDNAAPIQTNTLLTDYALREVDSAWRSGNTLRELPYSKQEVLDIARLFKEKGNHVHTFLYHEANEEQVKKSFNQFDIIHLATHGISSKSNPQLSGIFLDQLEVDTINNITNDGFLYLGELFTLPVKAKLVVLSACKTGAGKLEEGEGVMALPRGFIFAGVPNLVVSLWKIHDQKTKDLMVDFYAHLLDGQSYAQALQEAKIDQIKRGWLPMDWSGVVLLGE